MSENILGVYARFYTNPSESRTAADLREHNKEQFNEFLWGLNGVGGLSERLNKLKANDYGADLKKIFAQFGRVQRPVPQWATTTGLGLYIARQLAEAMNGRLELTRRKNGSSFLVNLQLSHQLSLFDL